MEVTYVSAKMYFSIKKSFTPEEIKDKYGILKIKEEEYKKYKEKK